MLLSHSILLGSLYSPSIRTFPRKFASRRTPTPRNHLLKFFFGHYGVAATAMDSSGPDEVLDGEVGGDMGEKRGRRDDEFVFLNLMEERGVRADSNTYAWLLDGCVNRASVVDAQRIHARILKLGFDRECVLCDRLIDVYLDFGDFADAILMFDGMPWRSFHAWNRMIFGFMSRKQVRNVLEYFARMLREYCGYEVVPESEIFTTVLRACTVGNVSLRIVQQLHAKIIRFRLGKDSTVGNPLIDFYAKKGCTGLAWLVFEELSSLDRISWVAMISGFSQNELHKEAILLYSEMCRSGVIPTTYALSSVLSACTKSSLFEQGRQVHGQTFKWGLCSEIYVCNALVALYSRCGNMDSAEQIFRKMARMDRITYNSLISGHSQLGNGENALLLFKKMEHFGLRPDCVTIASLLSACVSIGGIHQGLQLHSYVVKAGLSLDIIIEGSLLDFYVNCVDAETAYEFFNTTQKENVVLWNVMLMAYGRLGSLRESFDLFSKMQVEGIKPNQYTYPSILKTCTSVGALSLGEQIHNQIIKSGFELNVYITSTLIDMYAKCGRLRTAREILSRLADKDVVSWTAMIAGYAQHELYIEALRTFEEMQLHGIQSDNIGISSALSACAGIQAIEQGLQFHAQAFVRGYAKDLSVGNALISLYSRCGRLNDAYSSFESIEVANEVSWNGLISGFAQSGHCEEALIVFVRMNQAGLEANLFTFGSAICASANIADAKTGKQIHAKMIRTGYDLETEAGNALITFYSKCGSIEDAKMEFSLMSDRSEVSWNAMITGYSQHGCGHEALKLFQQMKLEGLKPNHITFVGVLSACSHVGLVTEGLSYFKSMNEEHNVLPTPEHHACVVDILGRAGQLDRAIRFINELPIIPDAMVWKTLLSACRVHKNTEIGELAANHLLELEPQDSATYVLLSNIYAVAKKWDCRDRVRQVMKDRGVKKEPGRSWIEVKNSIHAFFVGDKLHPLSDEIYKSLEDLDRRATEIGYVQDKDSILHDMEQENKDPKDYVHSEKLAVAFGLFSLSAEMPIRVMKNLRVCNDCHTWMKCVSSIVDRTIILRDGFRFHHFKDGACSCGNYW